MSLISIPSDELKAMDRRLAEQQQLLREQQAMIERIIECLQPWLDAVKEYQARQAEPAPAAPEPAGYVAVNLTQIIRGEK
jgi:small-conductance mechanosensitive channel